MNILIYLTLVLFLILIPCLFFKQIISFILIELKNATFYIKKYYHKNKFFIVLFECKCILLIFCLLYSHLIFSICMMSLLYIRHVLFSRDDKFIKDLTNEVREGINDYAFETKNEIENKIENEIDKNFGAIYKIINIAIILYDKQLKLYKSETEQYKDTLNEILYPSTRKVLDEYGKNSVIFELKPKYRKEMNSIHGRQVMFIDINKKIYIEPTLLRAYITEKSDIKREFLKDFINYLIINLNFLGKTHHHNLDTLNNLEYRSNFSLFLYIDFFSKTHSTLIYNQYSVLDIREIMKIFNLIDLDQIINDENELYKSLYFFTNNDNHINNKYSNNYNILLNLFKENEHFQQIDNIILRNNDSN